jgi:hypothetical protein
VCVACGQACLGFPPIRCTCGSATRAGALHSTAGTASTSTSPSSSTFASGTQHATRNTQHATRNTQHATRNTQHATQARYHALVSRVRRTRSECMRYWYMVMCHELAHNNVAAHNEEHEVRRPTPPPPPSAHKLSFCNNLFSPAPKQSLLSWLAFRHMEALNALLGSTQQRPPEATTRP